MRVIVYPGVSIEDIDMAVHQLPDHLSVPAAWARSVVFDDTVTARDLSYSIAVGWLSAQRDAALDGQDLLVADNGLRMALGMSRRDKAAVEENRVFRTSAATMTAAGLQAPTPIPSLTWITTDSGGVRVHRRGMRVQGDGQLQWRVPAPVSAAMRVGDGDNAVEMPWSLLQAARNKMAMVVMLRLLAMVRDDFMADRVVETEPGKLKVLVPWPDLVASLGLPAKSEPKETMRRFLAPAIAEINEHTAYTVTIAEHRVRYRAGPRKGQDGPLQGMMISVSYPVSEPPVAFPAPRVPYSPWKPAPLFHKPAKPQEPAPAFVDDIVPFPDDDDAWDPLDDVDDDAIPSGRPAADVPVSPAPVKRRFGIKRTDS